MSITVLDAPELKTFSTKAAKHLVKQKHCDGLFLPFPRESIEFVVRICEGLPENLVIPDLKKALEPILEPTVNSWTNSVEPILKALARIKNENPDMQPYCYKDSFFAKFETGKSGELAVLALKTFMSGKINTEEWKSVIKKEKKYHRDSLETEVAFIALHAENHTMSSCLSYAGDYFASRFQQLGFKTELISLGHYSLTPIEQLIKGVFLGNISDAETKKLVLLYLKYLEKYVYKSTDADEANYRWQIRKNPWKRLIFEIKKLSQK